jgi:hypothetical protein
VQCKSFCIGYLITFSQGESLLACLKRLVCDKLALTLLITDSNSDLLANIQGGMKMPLSEEVERIFKLRQQFKQCRVEQDLPEHSHTSNNSNNQRGSDGVSEISELIKKLKS